MKAETAAESTALVALLRHAATPTARLEVTAAVIGTGSATEVWAGKVWAGKVWAGKVWAGKVWAGKVWARKVSAGVAAGAGGGAGGEAGGEDLLAHATLDLAAWFTQGHGWVSIVDDAYPARLRGVHEAPPMLCYCGNLLADGRVCSVVGSRATLDAEGRAIAVIGTGLAHSYPAVNRALPAEIAQRGLLLSPFWPNAGPAREAFLRRNATMSGDGLAAIVIEAGERTGARVPARLAIGHGRRAILTELVVLEDHLRRLIST